MGTRILLLVTITLFLLSGSGLAETRFPFLGETTEDRVRIRAGGNNNFEVLDIIAKGETLIVAGKSFQWYKIHLPQSALAYIHADFVSDVGPQIAEVTGDRVNVRAAPLPKATILGQMKKGDKVFVRDRTGEWVAIRPGDSLFGWVHESLLAFKSQQIPQQADLDAAAHVKKMEEDREKKSALLKKLADGQVECSGMLIRTEGDPSFYKVVREKETVCIVEGPASLLETFVGGLVLIQGAPQEILENDEAARVVLSRIRRTF